MILKGEHLFVTGGAAGIGEALVIGGAKEGAKVSFVDIDDAKAHALVEKLTLPVPSSSNTIVTLAIMLSYLPQNSQLRTGQ